MKYLIIKPLTIAITLCSITWNLSLIAAETNTNSEVIIAQSEDGDAFDPFADYSDFSENQDEEADINFFKNGRFYTLGLLMGQTRYTSNYGNYMDPALNFGFFLNYFFDLRFAVQFTYLNSTHSFHINGVDGTPVSQNVQTSSMGLNLKYYFNTQNVTKGLAKLSPYIIGGMSNISQTAVIGLRTAKDSAVGFDIGGGIEIPLLRNAMYFGTQVTYQLVSFATEGSQLSLESGESTGVTLDGDLLNLNILLGVNF
ncbi:MAG: hypothetical protein HOO06_12235 [Bdellovibrionaceae bacterium]|jgi:hypothetical protein|nr:hypothetical protein [Pseudobdellovibrionaceae bacterium]